MSAAEPDRALAEDLQYSLGRIQQKLKQNPSDPITYNALGIVLGAKGQLQDAVKAFDHAIRLCPTYGEAALNKGLALDLLGDGAGALAALESAADLIPSCQDAERHAAGVARRIGARTRRSRWNSSVLMRLVDVLRWRLSDKEKPPSTDEISLRQALSTNPANIAAATTLGRLLRSQGRRMEAEHFLRHALRFDARSEAAAISLAKILDDQGKTAEAAGLLAVFNPERTSTPEILTELLRFKSELCDWRDFEPLRHAARKALLQSPASLPPFAALSLWDDPHLHLTCAKAFAEKVTAGVTPMVHRRPQGRPDKLKIGYASADFRQHAVATLVAEMFELHDRSRFRVEAYAVSPGDDRSLSKRIISACDGFTDLSDRPPHAAAEKIKSDGIDILVDLTGYTRGGKPRIFAHRPAPIQISYLGYPGMGASYLDYILVDGFIAPPGDERWYTEKLIRLPWCYQINDRRRLRPGAAQRKAFGLPEEATVLCCFNGNSKITPEVFGIWMRLLKEIPECLLWLRGWTPTADANLRHAASASGVDPARLIFADRCDYETHLSRYSVVDLALDTTPFVSHTTASDALWMGCPLITFAGASNTARVAGSLLRAAGLPELVTFSLQEYGELARKFAANRGALRRLRERIEGTRLTNRLFNSAAVTRQIERAYETAWDIFESGGPPRDFDVPDPDGAAAPPAVDAS